MAQNKPRAILLTPGEEYKDYFDFCTKENLPISAPDELYKGAYFLALRAVMHGFGDDNLSSYLLGDDSVSMVLHKANDNLFLLIFKTKDLEEYEAVEPEDVGPIDHLG